MVMVKRGVSLVMVHDYGKRFLSYYGSWLWLREVSLLLQFMVMVKRGVSLVLVML